MIKSAEHKTFSFPHEFYKVREINNTLKSVLTDKKGYF